MEDRNFIKKYIEDSIAAKKSILDSEQSVASIQKIADLISSCYQNGGKVLTAGNGGSAGDAQHIAAELVVKFYKERRALPAIALTTDSSIITAIGNDSSFDNIFSRQIQALGNKGDVFIAFSTSGSSKNIIEAIKEAKNKGLTIIGFTGQNLCKMDELCDCIIKVPSADTPKIQEAHIMLGHIICALVEKNIS